MLAAWAIPDEILAQAPESPWHLPVELFTPDPATPPTPSSQAAREALRPPGTVLDIGAGAGAMSAPVRDLASRIVAVDESEAMLEACVADEKVLGRWPDVAEHTPRADVVLCGHVLYNVPDLEDFLLAATAAAGRRVVVEITAAHPRQAAWERTLWRRFWGISRPSVPTWEHAVAVAQAIGITAQVEKWSAPRHGYASLDELVAVARRHLCLPESRTEEVRTALTSAVGIDGRWFFTAEPRPIVTLWWEPD